MNECQDQITWWRTETLLHGRPDCKSRWVADDDHDTREDAQKREAQLESQGLTARVRKMRGLPKEA
jgi:hypothetical protein